MWTIIADNVNQAFTRTVKLLRNFGDLVESRNGPTLELDAPLCVTYRQPWKYVLLDTRRKENPFFHLMEALWIIAGRRDVAFVKRYLKSIAQYSDDGEVFHGAYGYRMRHMFNVDQIQQVISRLCSEPLTRQAVIQIWSAKHDLNVSSKDIPCNDMIMFRVRHDKLDMTVLNRSNDIIWGMLGANVVQFSMLHQYISEMAGLPMGVYRQISNCPHLYTELNKVSRDLLGADLEDLEPQEYPDTDYVPMIQSAQQWDTDLHHFMGDTWGLCKEPFFTDLVIPAKQAWESKSKSPLLNIYHPLWKRSLLAYAERKKWK